MVPNIQEVILMCDIVTGVEAGIKKYRHYQQFRNPYRGGGARGVF